MADQLPTPPVPDDADLTAFKFMPLEVQRLRRSKAWLICKRKPELAFYMLNLWTASWHELPAGSLEDDEDVLADAAMCSPEKWTKVRRDVMRGWVKHSDGRLYHPVVAEKVMDSWHGRVMDRWRKECDRLRKENKKRADKNLPPLDLPPEPQKISATRPADSQRNGGGIPAENALKGREREGRGKGIEEDSAASAAAADAAPHAEVLPPEPDVKTAIFGAGLQWLRKACGDVSENSCRSFLGSLIADHGEVSTATCLLAAERAKPVDPRGWMKRNIGGPNGQRPRNGQIEGTSLSPELAGIAAAIARRSLQPG